MLRLVFAALFALLCWSPAQAQMAIPIASCGTLPTTLTPGVSHALYMDINGTLCTAGGGGGSSGAVFGPTAVGSPAANPPLLLGGTATGAATGAVQVAKVDASGNQYVQCANCTGSGASGVDSSAFTAASSVFAPYGGVYNDALTTLSSGQQAMQRMTPFRAAHSNLRNASGAEVGLAASPLFIGPGTGQTFPISATALPLPTGAATAAKQPALGTAGASSADVISIQGIAGGTAQSVSPSTLAAWGLTASTQNGATPTSAQLAMAQFNTTPTTITTGNSSPLQMDAAGNLLVNIKAGAGSGGTAATDNSVFTQGTTSETPMGCLYNTAYAVATSGRTTIPQCDSAGAQYVNVKNSNPNGAATTANSSPVALATDQTPIGTIAPLNTTPTNCSGTITTGGTAQNAFTAGATKHGFTILNLDTTEVLWISFTTTAAVNTVASYPLPAATPTTFASPGSFTSPTGFGVNTALSVVAATTGHKWSCTWW